MDPISTIAGLLSIADYIERHIKDSSSGNSLWDYCAKPKCNCNLPKVCTNPKCNCSRPKMCLERNCSCSWRKGCPKLDCDCGLPKVYT